MRALLDTNVFISFLLGSGLSSPPVRIVIAGIRGHFAIIYSEKLVAELKRKIVEKPYLAANIPASEVDILVGALAARAIFIEDETNIFPEISRDPADDFLLAHAALGRADYLVSGDHDLLDLGAFEGLGIVSPAAFANILEA